MIATSECAARVRIPDEFVGSGKVDVDVDDRRGLVSSPRALLSYRVHNHLRCTCTESAMDQTMFKLAELAYQVGTQSNLCILCASSGRRA